MCVINVCPAERRSRGCMHALIQAVSQPPSECACCTRTPVPMQAWGGAEVSIPEAEALGQAVRQKGAGGLMLWALTKSGRPSPQALSQSACRVLGLPDCDAPMQTARSG